MTLTQPRLYSRPSEAKFLPMLRKSSFKLHIWKAVRCSTRELPNVLPIELLMPSFLKR
jgi:hypothetical protein